MKNYKHFGRHPVRWGKLAGVLLLSLFWYSLAGQRPPKVEALTIDEGLGFRNVTAIAQDRQGLMWFGTQQGLNRYDGYRFNIFSSNTEADNFFPGDAILDNSLIFVNDSTMWVVADKRLYSLNIHDFSIAHLSAEAGIGGEVVQIQQAIDGSIWLVWGDESGQYLWRNEDGRGFEQVASVPRLRQEFTSLATDTSGNAWWSTVTGGLQQYSSRGELLHEVKIDSFEWFGTTMYFTPVYVDSRNRIFVLPKSAHQIWQYFPDKKRKEVIADSLSTLAYFAREDSRGSLWFATKTGVLRWDREGRWENFSAALNGELQFSEIHGLYEDRTNMLWVSTDNGLLKFPIQKQLFQNYMTVPGASWGNTTRGMFEDTSGQVYVYCEAGEQGLHRVDPKTGESSLAVLSGDGASDLSLLEQTRHYVFDPAENAAWTLTDKLIRIGFPGAVATVVAKVPAIGGKFSHNPLIRLKDGSLLLGSTLEKLTVFDPATGGLQKFVEDTSAHLKTCNTEFFLENGDGSIWVATASEGLYRFSRSGQVLQHLFTASHPALSKNHLLVLHRADDGKLWIGTFGGGLNRYDPATNEIRIFTRKEGLAGDNVTGILSDGEGNIWVATYTGLSSYRNEEGTFQNFYEEDGLTNNEFNYSSFFKDSSGRLWFGGMNGVNVFRPAQIAQHQVNPPLCFTSFSKYSRASNEQVFQLYGSRALEDIVISPYDSYFQFTWTLPNYFKPDKNHYFVWLEGLDDDWLYIGNTPSIRYNKLPDGHYTLHIKGADSKGNWSASELAVAIRVKPFFYQTWWFVLLAIGLVAGIVYAIARYRLQRLLEMERMRTKIASDLHDEVGSMLSGLAMQAEILELNKKQNDPARLRYLSEISRQAVSKMRDLVWSIDSRRDQVKNLLDRMREHAAEMLTPYDIAFRFQLGDLPLEKKMPVIMRQHLFLIFKEAVTNICRHSCASSVVVFLGNRDGRFEMSIADNGSGVAGEEGGTSGLGMANMRMRAEALGAEFSVEKSNGFLVKIRMKLLS